MTPVLPTKDEENEHPIPTDWRPTLAAIVEGIARGDEDRLSHLPGVVPPSAELLAYIRKNIAAYGETVITLSEDTWRRSVCRWRRTSWDLLVDLWTAESGRSDLALHVRVFEAKDGFRFEIDSVHVP
jgi:hypothetical protein